jgi:hypothetical protein
LDRVEKDPTAVVCLADSAYHRSSAGNWSTGPSSERWKTAKGRNLSFFSPKTDMQSFKGEEVKQSHKVQSVRGVVEQTIRDLKCFKVMESNKINSAEKFEKCWIV